MESSEIKEQVKLSIAKWQQLERMRQSPVKLTDGAEELIVQMIVNIEKDPSPYWKSVELDAVQRFAISTIPNVLIDMDRRYLRIRMKREDISSWEILHNISRALDNWCPIPKDI